MIEGTVSPKCSQCNHCEVCQWVDLKMDGCDWFEEEPKTKWIPVSERLPENHDDVLVWVEYIKDDYDCAWWALAYYSRQHKKWVVSTNGRNPIVKAWMPLPEPYKASPAGAEGRNKE